MKRYMMVLIVIIIILVACGGENGTTDNSVPATNTLPKADRIARTTYANGSTRSVLYRYVDSEQGVVCYMYVDSSWCFDRGK